MKVNLSILILFCFWKKKKQTKNMFIKCLLSQRVTNFLMPENLWAIKRRLETNFLTPNRKGTQSWFSVGKSWFQIKLVCLSSMKVMLIQTCVKHLKRLSKNSSPCLNSWDFRALFRNPITPLDSPTPLRSTLRDRSAARLFDQGSQGLADWLEVVGNKKVHYFGTVQCLIWS